jgi:carbohydrate-selective porin OprB
MGLGWARPSNEDLTDEHVIETSYKVQLSKNFSLLPDVQLVLGPANNPDKGSIWVVGLRGILTL